VYFSTGFSVGEEIMQIQARFGADAMFVMVADGGHDAGRIGERHCGR
jgi:hypothetical protein